VEPVDIDTRRGTPEVIAKLTVDVSDMERRFGLRFAPVANDLSPAVMALGRLSTGTLVGFARLAHDPAGPGVDLVQFGEREPRDVLIELLHDTGLTHDQVSWTLPPRGQEDTRLWARTTGEAYLYFLMHAGPELGTDEEVLDAIRIHLISPAHNQTMRLGDTVLWVPPVPPDLPLGRHIYSAPGQPPSTLIDAGQWTLLAYRCGQTAAQLMREYADEFDADMFEELDENLMRAASSFDEAVKFAPAGTERIPVTACWTPQGLQVYRDAPQLFERATLAHQAVQHHQAVADLRARFAHVFRPARS
jgi:hypothetical protein